jgi:hypothetical protein
METRVARSTEARPEYYTDEFWIDWRDDGHLYVDSGHRCAELSVQYNRNQEASKF